MIEFFTLVHSLALRGGAAGPAGPVLAGPLFGRIIIKILFIESAHS